MRWSAAVPLLALAVVGASCSAASDDRSGPIPPSGFAGPPDVLAQLEPADTGNPGGRAPGPDRDGAADPGMSIPAAEAATTGSPAGEPGADPAASDLDSTGAGTTADDEALAGTTPTETATGALAEGSVVPTDVATADAGGPTGAETALTAAAVSSACADGDPLPGASPYEGTAHPLVVQIEEAPGTWTTVALDGLPGAAVVDEADLSDLQLVACLRQAARGEQIELCTDQAPGIASDERSFVAHSMTWFLEIRQARNATVIANQVLDAEGCPPTRPAGLDQVASPVPAAQLLFVLLPHVTG